MPNETTLERPLPQHLDAERSILGAILLDNQALNAAIENLRPEDFFFDPHRRVFQQMVALGETQQAIDLVTLNDALDRRGELESCGGTPYLASLVDGVPRSANIEHYVRIVKEKALLRNLIHATHAIQERASAAEESADGILAGLPVAIFSLEMSKESLLQRLVASVAQIDAHKFRTGHLGREDWRRMTEALGQIASAPLWIDDASSLTVVEIGAKARRLKREKGGLALLIVDYLQLISARGRFSNRNEEVSSITRGLKGLAKELQIPVLVLSQLTRAPERDERRPQLADLRESGAIEQDADVVMFIYRPNFFKVDALPEERDQADLLVAKQRNGPTDRVRLIFKSRQTRFEEAAPDAFSQFIPDDA